MSAHQSERKQSQREIWAAGDYAEVAKTIESGSDAAVEAAGIESGDVVLDVACGTGNAALAAARRGARVTGIDFTPALLDVARGRAAAEELEIEFIEGDAEALPFDDDSFDVVSSVFGAMFAPDHQRAASELLRVCRPGGTVVVAAWTPEDLHGQMFPTIAKYLPPPPEGFQPPILWGLEDHVRGLFAGASDVRCEVRQAVDAVHGESVDAWLDYLERAVPPVALAKAQLEPAGKWDAARADLFDLYSRFNEADDGTIRADPDYLLTIVRR